MDKFETYCQEDFLLHFFDNFIVDPLDSKNQSCKDLFDLLLKKADICIDSTDKMINETSNPYVKHLLKMSTSGGSKIIPLSYQFRNIDEDVRSLFVANPSPLYYFKNHHLGGLNNYGIHISDTTNYHQRIYQISQKPNTFRVNRKNSLNHFTEWKILKENLPPLNSLVIADNYFLDNQELYPQNIFQMLSVILPLTIENQDFHLTIITKKDLLNRQKKFENISNFLNSLNKEYHIKFGIFFTDTNEPHDRDLISNYFRIKAGYSFDIFNRYGVPKRDTEINYIPVNSESTPKAHFGLLKTLAYYTRDAEFIGTNENRLLDYFR